MSIPRVGFDPFCIAAAIRWHVRVPGQCVARSELVSCHDFPDRYEKRHARHHKMVVHPAPRAAIQDRLKAGWSPEQNADRRDAHVYRTFPKHRRRPGPSGHRSTERRQIFEVLSVFHWPENFSGGGEFGGWTRGRMQFRKAYCKMEGTPGGRTHQKPGECHSQSRRGTRISKRVPRRNDIDTPVKTAS